MNITRFLLSSLTLSLAVAVNAVPARRGLRTITQPDGSQLTIQLVGDEHSHYTLTADRMLLTSSEDGTYCYARFNEAGQMVNTGIKAVDPDLRTNAVAAVMQSIDAVPLDRLNARVTTSSRRRAIPQNGMGTFTTNFPNKGDIKVLVILVEYQDVKFTLSDPHTYFYNMLNQEGFKENGGTGSARDYFLENSGGLFKPQIDVFGPYTLPNNMSYYGGNDDNGDDKAPEDMVIHGCRGLDNQINFADYDMDNDGYVDNVYVIYAGQGEASYGSENTVWPHSWELTAAGKSLTLDGKKFDKYACSNEWEQTRPDGIGTFVHEFSHVMGLPDLYVTTYGSDHQTPGEWSVLDYGPYNNDGRTPPAYSIYERNAMKWCEPKVINQAMSGQLEHILTSNEGYIIVTEKSNEFFLLENRQKKGWDAYIPGHGMLIWHIDYNQSIFDKNSVNNTQSHQYVQIEPSNNSYTKSGVAGWAWPNSSTRNSFTPTTSPAMKSWAGKAVNYPITNIKETGGVITFDVLGGKPEIETPVIDQTPIVTLTGFSVQWSPVEGATNYIINVKAASSETPVSQNYDSSKLPEGWSQSSGMLYYTSSGNYKTGTRSLKFDSSSSYVRTGTYTGSVNKISFWYKSQQGLGSVVKTEGLINDTWVTLNELTLEKTSTGYITLNNLEASNPGIKQVKISYTKAVGNVAIDDITIVTGGKTAVGVPGYIDAYTGGSTSMNVNLTKAIGGNSGIDADHKLFSVTVKATNGNYITPESPEVLIDLSQGNSGIEGPAVDNLNAEPTYYNLQGVKVDNPGPGLYIVRRGNVINKEIVR